MSLCKKPKAYYFFLIPGVARAGLEGFRGSWRGNRVGRVEVASLARGGSGNDQRAGSSPYVAPFYEQEFTEDPDGQPGTRYGTARSGKIGG